MKIVLVALLAAAPLLADSSASLPPNPYEKAGGHKSPVFTAANSEAIHWINLVDQQQYAASWGDASPLFKDLIQEDQWVGAMRGTRQPMGQVISRKVGQHRTTEQLPGGLRGNFIEINYETQYSNKAFATERITLMTNHLGQWRVISFAILKQ